MICFAVVRLLSAFNCVTTTMSSILWILSRHRIPRFTARVITHHRPYSKDLPKPDAPSTSDAEPTVEVFSSKAKTPTTPLFTDHAGIRRRAFATEQLPRPPPSKEPAVETFDNTSKPKPYHGLRPPPRTELPLEKVRQCPFPPDFTSDSNTT